MHQHNKIKRYIVCLSTVLFCVLTMIVFPVYGEPVKQITASRVKDAHVAQPPDDMFIDVQIPSHQIYRGEVMRIEYDVYVATKRGQVFYDADEPDFMHWYSIEGPAPQGSFASFEGKSYTKEPFAVYYVSSSISGKIALPAINVQIPYLSGKPWITHVPRVIEVIELPAGAPDGFYWGNVGQYEITSDISTQHAAVGDVITLRIEIRGNSPVAGINPVPYDLKQESDAFKMYPMIQEDMDETGLKTGLSSRRTFRIKFLALKSGKWVLPPVEFVSFDPQIHQYRHQETESFEIEIEEGELPELEPPRATTNFLETKQIKPIHLVKASNAPMPGYYWMALPPAVLLMCIGYAAVRRRRIRQKKAQSFERECDQLVSDIESAADAASQLKLLRSLLEMRCGIQLTQNEAENRCLLTSLFNKTESDEILSTMSAIRLMTYSTREALDKEAIHRCVEIILRKKKSMETES